MAAQLHKPLRICRRCGLKAWTEEDLEQFKKSPTSHYGREPVCKKCWNEFHREYAKKHREETRVKHQEYMKTYYERHQKERVEYSQRYREEHPERITAQNKARIEPLASACEVCGSTTHRLERHHPDYSKPREFVTLCAPCHHQIHKSNGE